jgi:hypothetical protein
MYVTKAVSPEKKEGKSLDLQFTVNEKNADEARSIFITACQRLLDPAVWNQLSGTLTANFAITNSQGIVLHRKLKERDFLRITLPSPGEETGKIHDWVTVERIAANIDLAADESLAITLRPSKNPASVNDDTAHFFKDNATSTFIISLKNKAVTAFYFGRNEIPNTDVPGILNKLRNGMVAIGAMAGLSNLQWTALLKGLLHKEMPEN